MAEEQDREQLEDEAGEAAPAPAEETTDRPRKKKKKKRRVEGPGREPERDRGRPRPAQLPPEREIGAPSKQTLVLLGVMALATLLMWGSARFACNAHPAQTRKPRDVSTQELARDPKDAALELQQRWNSYDFKGALELAKGAVAAEIAKAQSECDKNPSDCESKKKSVEGQALATAALLSRESGSAKVRVVSRGGAMGDATVVYALEQEGGLWKVSGRTTAPTPAPAPTAAPSGSVPAPAPSASADPHPH